MQRTPSPGGLPPLPLPPIPGVPGVGVGVGLPPPPLPPAIPLPLPPPLHFGPPPVSPPSSIGRGDGEDDEAGGDRSAFVQADIEFFKRHVGDVKISVDSPRSKVWRPDVYTFSTPVMGWIRPAYRS